MKTKKEYFDLKKLVKVTVYDFDKSNWLVFKKRISLFNITLRKAGIYTILGDKVELPDDCILCNGVVFNKPFVHLLFTNEAVQVHRFDSLKEACYYAEQIVKHSESLINNNFI